MTFEKSVLGIVPGLQATSLLAHNIPKNFNLKKTKISPNKFVSLGMTNLVGIGMIKPTASMINTL